MGEKCYKDEVEQEHNSTNQLSNKNCLLKLLSCCELQSVELGESVSLIVQILFEEFVVVVKIILQSN